MIWQAFRPDQEGIFRSRPNRFVALVETPRGLIRAHCPNPGRLREILLPGSPVLLETAPTADSSVPRSTQATLVAVNHRGLWVPLASARANEAAGLWLKDTMKDWELRSEYTLGGSRFDWAAFQGSQRRLFEVKACTLEHRGVAMFPDAPSLRATKHLEHLAHAGENPTVVFVTWFPEAKSFTPHLHTDPTFAQVALSLGDRIRFRALVWKTGQDGKAELVNDQLPVDLSPLQGVDYRIGIPAAAWETPTKTIFAWVKDFKAWEKSISRRSWVLGRHPGLDLGKVNDLRVYAKSDLTRRFQSELEGFTGARWIKKEEHWELEVPGRPLDTQEFWDWFLPYRHSLWKD